MQTFVPEPNLKASMRVLDNKRLGKQRVETLQIMNALAGKSKGWTNHPATCMWKGYENALMIYQTATVREWLSRGYKDTCFDKTKTVWLEHFGSGEFVDPPWWGDMQVHDSHKAALVFKDPMWYNAFYPDIEGKYDYYWPVTKENN